MPTGYTHKVSEGSEPSFESFVLRCSTAMGACIMQRDSSNQYPDLSVVQPDSYYKEKVDELNKEIIALHMSTDQELQDKMIQEFNESRELYVVQIQKQKAQMFRYQEMLKKVLDWCPPTPEHYGLKSFMIEQLESSINFDDSSYYERKLAELKEPNTLDLVGYRVKQLAELCKDYDYHKGEYDKDRERNENRVQWITDLFDNLGVEVIEDKVVPRG